MKIEVKALHKSIDGKEVLHDISAALGEGELFTIVGPSGSGKTMFLRTLNRLTEPDSGEILLDGISIKTLDPRVLRRRVGMVFQLPILFPGTVAENILTGPGLWKGKEKGTVKGSYSVGVDAGQMNLRIDVSGLLDSVGLSDDFSDKDAGKLSVGEQQRVCIARALANDPEVLLMDEPTASLDPTTTLKIEALITSLNRNMGLTFVIVTHDMEQAKRIGHTTMYMENGQVREIRPTSSFFTEDPFQERDAITNNAATKGDNRAALTQDFPGDDL